MPLSGSDAYFIASAQCGETAHLGKHYPKELPGFFGVAAKQQYQEEVSLRGTLELGNALQHRRPQRDSWCVAASMLDSFPVICRFRL
jgi:hypothetical protein